MPRLEHSMPRLSTSDAFNLEKETKTLNPNKMELKTTNNEEFKGAKGERTKNCK